MCALRLALSLAVLSALGAVATGCGESDHALTVDVRSDLVAGTELSEVRTNLVRGAEIVRSDVRTLTAADDLWAGIRAAELTAPTGEYTVEVFADGPAGDVSRTVLVGLEQSLAITVVLSSDCVDVRCPQDGDSPLATECVEGTCRVPDCVGECGAPDTGPSDTGLVADTGTPPPFPCPGIVDRRDVTGAGTPASATLAGENFPAPNNVIFVGTNGAGPGGMTASGIVGSVLARRYNGPVIMSQPDAVWGSVQDYLRASTPMRVYLMGSETVISVGVSDTVRSIGPNTIRIGGSGNAVTAADVANRVGSPDGRAFFTSRADANLTVALVAANAASMAYRPLLFMGNTIPADTEQAVRDLGIHTAEIFADETVIDAAAVAQLQSLGVTTVTRHTAPTAQDLSVHGAETFGPDATRAGLVNTAQPHMGQVLAARNEPLLLINAGQVPPVVADYLRGSPITSVQMVGPFGNGEAIERELCAILAVP